MEPRIYDIEHGYGPWTGSYNYVNKKLYKHLAPAFVGLAAKSAGLGYLMTHLRGHKKRLSGSTHKSGSCLKKNPFAPYRYEQKQGVCESKDDMLNTVIHGGITEKLKDDINGNQVISLHARAAHRRKTSNRALVDKLMFPRIVVKLRSYGTALVSDRSVSGLSIPNLYDTIAAVGGNGNTRSISCNQKTATWVEFAHLLGGTELLKTPGTVAVPNTNLCSGYTLKTLRAIARDSSMLSTSSTSWNAIAADDFSSSNQAKYFQSLNYNGGKTIHFFQNPGNLDVVMEFFVCRPKHMSTIAHDPLSNWSVDLTSQYVGMNGITDATGTGGVQIAPTTSGFIESKSVDPIFTIRGAHHHIHHDWLVEKPKRIVLRGGGLVKFAIDHPAFCFADTPFNLGVIGAQDNTTYNQFEHIPGCSVYLIVKIQGQMVTNDTGNVTVTQLNTAACQVAHWQYEYHNIRAGLVGNTDLEFNKDFITDTVTTPQFDNPLVDSIQTASF